MTSSSHCTRVHVYTCHVNSQVYYEARRLSEVHIETNTTYEEIETWTWTDICFLMEHTHTHTRTIQVKVTHLIACIIRT